MQSELRIIRLRKEQPLLTGSDIGRKIGVSRQYVSKILKKEGLHNRQPTYKTKIVLCLVCNKTTPRGTRLCPTGDCKQIYYNIEVTCAFCKFNFTIKRAHIVQRYKRGWNHIYCSKKCYNRGQRDGLS